MNLVQQFKDYLLSLTPAPSAVTVKNYIADIKHFIGYVETTKQQQFQPALVHALLLQQYKQDSLKSLSASSVERHLSSLRKFFAYLKLMGTISQSPFELGTNSSSASSDNYHLKEFKDFLYVYNASNLTIKNYIIDVKQFLSWAEQVTGASNAFSVKEKNVLLYVNSHLVNEYKERLIEQNVFSASSINRKLSSLRKYLAWCASQKLLNAQIAIPDNLNGNNKSISTDANQLPENNNNLIQTASEEGKGLSVKGEENFSGDTGGRALDSAQHLGPTGPSMRALTGGKPGAGPENHSKTYSSFPPLRLLQKITNGLVALLDALLIEHLAKAALHGHKTLWKLNGKKLFAPANKIQYSRFRIQEITSKLWGNSFLNHESKIVNLPKELFAPLSISTTHFPWYKKLWHHARYTRPTWYRKYHQLALAHYFNWAILIIIASAIGFGMYSQFVKTPGKSLAALPTAPLRILSFQGRLTDSNDNPITANTWLRFVIYNDTSASGSARLWEEERKVTPDTDGIFSVLLGSDGSGGQASLCNSGNPPTSPATGSCGIPSSLFANNNALWMGVTVESTPELTPRQQLATVAFAANAETLQGLHPITESGAGQTNVVLALDSHGDLTIGGSATPTFTASGGQFTLSGNVLALNTNAGSNSNIQLAPDGSGIIDTQKPLQNTTLNNNITSAAGAVEVDDLFAVLATSSGQSAVTINQNGSGPIISASASGSPKFTVANSGAVTAPSFFDLDNSNYFLDPAAAGNSLVVNGSVGIGVINPTLFKLQIAGSIGPDATNTYDLGSSARQWNNIYGNNIYSNGQLLTQLWQRNLGVVSPLNITDDIAVGQTATGTAKFQIFGLTGNATTAGNLTFTGGSVSNVIATRNNQGLTIGDSQTGNITFSPLGGSGFLTVNAASETVGNAGNYTIQTTSNGVLSLLSSGTGNITLGQNAGLGNVVVQPNAGGSAALEVIKQGPNGDIFTASAAATPEFTIQHDGTIVSGKYTTAGGVFFTNSSGVFTQASNASANTVLHGGSTPSFSAVDLTADVTGTLPINKGGTNTTSIGSNGAIAYSDGSKYVFTAVGSAGTCLQSNGGGAPTWGACGSGGSNFWTLDSANGTLYPINATLDTFVGGTSTASAKFAVLNIASGTPTASVSSGLNGVSSYLTATGTLATTNMQPLSLGNSTTGAINIGTDATARSITLGNSTGATSVTLNAGPGNINFYSTSNKIDSSGNLTLAGTITANNTNTINGLSINSGALSGVTGYTQNSGNFDQSGSSGFFKTGTGAVSLNGDTTLASGKNFTQSGSGTFSTGTGNVSINGGLAVDLLPTGNGSINLGSSSHYYNTVYANNFIAPVGNGTSGFWVLNTDLLYPANSFYDLAVGGNATGSATPWQVFATTVGVDKAGTATSSGNLAFRGSNAEVDLLNGTGLNFKQSVGGDSGLASVLAIGQDGNVTVANNLAVNGGDITTTKTSATLFNSNATSINIGSGATSGIGIGNAAGSNTIHGSVVLGDSSSNTINPNGYFGNSLIPSANNSYDLGSSSNKWKNLYIAGTQTIGGDSTITGTLTAGNILLSSSAQYGGFWQRNSGTISPFNITDDILAGGTATTSAKFALLNMTGSGNPTASVSSGLNGNGMYFDAGGNIQTVRNQGLTIGGATTGNITLSPLNSGTGSTINLNAKTIDDNQATVTLFGTPTSITFGGAATTANLVTSATTLHLADAGATTTLSIGGSAGTTTVNNALTTTGTFTANGNAVLGASSSNTVNVLANFISSLIPNAADTYNLGSVSKEWDTLYVRQIVTPSNGGIAGFWQLSNAGVLSPANLTNDLAVGGIATSSSVFQVFANPYGGSPAGTASTSGYLTFNSAAPVIQTTNMAPLTIGSATTGPIQLSPKGTTGLNVNRLGNVGIGTTNPVADLDLAANGQLWIRQGAGGSLGSSAGSGLKLESDTNGGLVQAYNYSTSTALNLSLEASGGSVGIGTSTPLSSTGLDIQKNGLGNSVLAVNQTGLGDILTASASGATEFQLTNSGILRTRQFQDLDNTNYFLDPASGGTSLNIAGTASVSADLTFYGNGLTHNVYTFDNGNLDFQMSPGGANPTTGVVHALYLQGRTGNVGIGTTSPSLSNGTSNALLDISGSNNPGVAFNNTSASHQYLWYADSSGNMNLYDATNNANRITVLSGGDVGIGTASPSYPLTVSGDDSAPGDTTGAFSIYAASNSNQRLHMGYVTASDYAYIESVKVGTNLEPLVLNPRGGNVGIGTTSPQSALNLASSGVFQIGANTDSEYASMTNDSLDFNRTNNAYIDNISGGALRLGIGNISSGSNGVTIDSSNHVGIGTTAPSGMFTVNGNITSGGGSYIGYFLNGGGFSDNYGIRIAAGFNTSGNNSRFASFSYGNNSTELGKILGNGAGGITYATTSDFRIKTDIQPTHFGLGQLLQIPVVDYHLKDNLSGEQQTGFIAQWLYKYFPNAVTPPSDPNDWYNNFNPNDLWTVDYGRITPLLVKSIQDLNTKLDVATASANSQLTLLSAANANLDLSGSEDIILNDTATSSANFTIPHYYTLSDVLGNPIHQIAALSEAVIGNLRVGSLQAQQTITNSLAVTTGNVSIAGQSLHDYIAGIVTSMINNQSSTLNSPIASVDQLHVNLISPLASGSAVALQLDNSGINIQNTNSQQTVARIDNSGNATFSGQLSSQNLAVNGDATVSGTLHANRIEANTIAGLQAVVSTLSAQNITNVTNIFFATPSATPTGENIATGSNGISNGNSQVPTGSVIPGSDQGSMDSRLRGNDTYANIASYSAYLAYVPSLTAETGQFNQGLISLGSTSLADTSIAGQLSINGSLILSDNSINVLGNDFQIQPLRQGGVSFEGGLLAIDTNGNLTVNGNAVFNGNLAAKMISPLGNDKDLSIQLGQNSATGSALATSSLSVKNASGSGVFAIDQLGNIVASGAANIGKLNFALVQPALAVSNTEVVATGSAGTAAIKIHQVEVTIDNPQVSATSLIYITPVGTTDGIVPYLLRQVPGKSFTVGIPYDRLSDTNFNWLIVN